MGKKLDAVEEAGKMMKIKMCDLPQLAIEFLKFLSHKYGFCGEICITAYAAYNQMVLKMKCDDDLYKVTQPESIEWWNNKGYVLDDHIKYNETDNLNEPMNEIINLLNLTEDMTQAEIEKILLNMQKISDAFYLIKNMNIDSWGDVAFKIYNYLKN
jgi:hypothetical protein